MVIVNHLTGDMIFTNVNSKKLTAEGQKPMPSAYFRYELHRLHHNNGRGVFCSPRFVQRLSK